MKIIKPLQYQLSSYLSWSISDNYEEKSKIDCNSSRNQGQSCPSHSCNLWCQTQGCKVGISKFRLLLDVSSTCGFVSLLCRVFCQDRAAMPQNHLLLVYRYVVLCKAGMLAQDSMCKSLKRPVKDTHKLLH